MDIIAPTPERVAKAGDCYEAQSVDRQLRVIKPARVLSRFEKLEASGKITVEQKDAGMKFEKNWELSTRSTVTASYGTRFAEGTPVSQIAERGDMEDTVRRVDWYGDHKRAVAIIGEQGLALMSACIAGASEELLGRLVVGRGCRKGTALIRGRAALWIVLDKLSEHYRPKKPPR